MYNKKIFERCFSYRGKYWYENIKEIPRYFKLMHHLIKYGYDEYATWETFDWFIDTMKSILTEYRKYHWGYPGDGRTAEEWDAEIDRAIELLHLMDENTYEVDLDDYNELSLEQINEQYKERHKMMDDAKDEFFKWFSKNFYTLWD